MADDHDEALSKTALGVQGGDTEVLETERESFEDARTLLESDKSSRESRTRAGVAVVRTLKGPGAEHASVEPMEPTLVGEADTLPPVPTDGMLGVVLDGKYELLRLLGEGGMGAVYEARHQVIGNRVAVKMLHPEAARQDNALARFEREAQAAGTIGHPNIVKVHDIGKAPPEGLPYMVMDFIEGESLAEVIYRDCPLEPARSISIVTQMLSALEAAHEKGIVHRDIKPENVLISTGPEGEEVARLLDFGISKFREIDPDQQSLTRTGTILGTPLYMAPEQARGDTDIDHRIDLYAVGTTLYVMLSGHQPYLAPNYNALIVKIITQSPRALSDLNPELDPSLVAVVEKAMARKREDRFSSAQEFIDALEGRVTVERRPPAVEAPLSRPRAGRGKGWAVLAAALVLGGAAALFFAGPGGSTSPPEAPAPRGASVLSTKALPTVEAGLAATDGAPEAGSTREGWVKLRTAPAGARLLIDGQLVANPYAARHPLGADEALEVEVTARGYQPYRRQVVLDGELDEIITLSRLTVGAGSKQGKAPAPMLSKGLE